MVRSRLRDAAILSALMLIPLSVNAHETPVPIRGIATSANVTISRNLPMSRNITILPNPTPALPQRQSPNVLHSIRPVSAQPQQSGPTRNAIYGAIARIVGNVLTIRTRTGRLRDVDATPAFAAGTVSAPLFVGKLVVAEGLTRTDGVLTAARISRLPRLEQTDADR